ncbi:hypothetical protein LINPERPRIM_LOCUS33594 [Linum perenne]
MTQTTSKMIMVTADTKKMRKRKSKSSTTKKRSNRNHGIELGEFRNPRSECRRQSCRTSSSGCRRRECRFESTMYSLRATQRLRIT